MRRAAARSDGKSAIRLESGFPLLHPGPERFPTLNLRYGLGIDAGGTYTDVVIHDYVSSSIVAKHKALTTIEFTISDDIAPLSGDQNLFLGQTIVGAFEGQPDLLLDRHRFANPLQLKNRHHKPMD